jgi:hypothetical protein
MRTKNEGRSNSPDKPGSETEEDEYGKQDDDADGKVLTVDFSLFLKVAMKDKYSKKDKDVLG